VTATTRATPRIACSAVTTGAIIQLGSNSLDSPRQPVEPGFGVLQGLNIILQHDLLRRMGTAHCGQPVANHNHAAGFVAKAQPTTPPLLSRRTASAQSRDGSRRPKVPNVAPAANFGVGSQAAALVGTFSLRRIGKISPSIGISAASV
jgi:hypothetical protein